MKWHALSLWLLALAFLGVGAFPYVPGLVTSDNVNLRVEPSLRAEIVGQLQRGDRVEVILQDGEWCAIAPPAEIAGWVGAEFIGPDGAATAAVNVRSGPGVSHARLARLEPGQRPEIIQREEGWFKITLPRAARLWVSARYVNLPREAPESHPRPASDQAGFKSPVPPTKNFIPTPAPHPVGTKPSPTPPPVALTVLPLPSHPVVAAPPSPPPPEPMMLRRPSPSPPAAEAAVFSGVLLKLPQSYREKGRLVTHFLVRDEQNAVITARLVAPETDLDRYQRRRVRLWGVEVSQDVGSIPLVEVKGVQAVW